MTKYIKTSIIFLFALNIFAQRAGNADEWVESGQMLRFPASQFFTAVGIGTDERLARENALVEIKRQISANVDSRVISHETQTGSERVISFSEESQISVSGNIEGVQIVATATRNAEFFAFASLNKERFVAAQRLKIQELQAELSQSWRLGQEAANSGNVERAISLFNAALAIIHRIEEERALLSAATTLSQAEEVNVSRTQINSHINSLLSGLSIVFAGENNALLFAEDVKKKDLVFRLSSNQNPARNVSVILLDETGRRIATTTSDENGMANFSLGDTAPASRGTHRFFARISLNGIQNTPEAQISYTVRTREMNARISVEVSPELRASRRDIERAVNVLFSTYGITHTNQSRAQISVSVSDVLGESIQGVSAARSFVRSNASLQITASNYGSEQKFSTEISRSSMANNRNAAVVDAIRGMRLSADIGDIQDIIRGGE